MAFQSIGIFKLKKAIRKIHDPELQSLYARAINSMVNNVQELLKFYPKAPVRDDYETEAMNLPFYSGDLLGLTKTAVRNYAIAITETATPQLRNVLVQQLNKAIQSHADIYNYMYKRGYYPSYNLTKLLENDIKVAQIAISIPY
ncbi:spore coat protein [Bacillus sp. 03113]|uniref:spore coat protein n=1 Tax=Bacillus sp. 03113 TaxID=2578211 RepID=UPI00215CEBC6|nr:spore coat protein [Bacillus sp. 03113]